jgi:hypothetical protein
MLDQIRHELWPWFQAHWIEMKGGFVLMWRVLVPMWALCMTHAVLDGTRIGQVLVKFHSLPPDTRLWDVVDSTPAPCGCFKPSNQKGDHDHTTKKCVQIRANLLGVYSEPQCDDARADLSPANAAATGGCCANP